ncbi:ParB family chromosome partitioning protein [Pseudomonas frederiksbergensis]|uniref:PRTRC system ParB family protein n=1 Tax=Pseudomonas TaxID=286 RepID=UPI003D1DF414
MTDLSQVQAAPATTVGGEQRVPLSQMRRNPNIDPRKSRNRSDYREIVESIRVNGVMQSIMIRPITGADVPYEVVAGNTRFDGSVELGLYDIPVIIREMTDAEARSAAAIENLKRSNLTPIDEAQHAKTMLTDHANDHDEVCRLLGWDRQYLDRRVLLSKCCTAVSEALTQGQIKLGHAELLAPMADSEQEMICGKIIERGLTVGDTKKRLSEMFNDITAARFDTTECQRCPSNSALYGDLFQASLDGAKCQNHSCWEAKTAQLIEVRTIEAQADYGVVHTDASLPTDGYVLLVESGQNGVGAAQISACVACKNYGAVVSTKAGLEGHTVGGYCFDRHCNSERQADYQELIAQTSGAKVVTTATGEQEASTQEASGATPTAGKKANAKPTAKAPEMKRAIRREAFDMYARMGAVAIQSDKRFVLAISIVSLYLDMRSDLPAELSDRMKKTVGFPDGLASYSRAPFEAELAQQPLEKLEAYLVQLAACSVFRKDSTDQFQKSVAGAQSLSVIKATGMNPVEYFKMTESYLKSLTKAGVIADCKASGFDKKYDEVKGDKEFSKLAGGKADDLMKAILAFTEFTWEGYLPDTMKIECHDGSGTTALGQ